MTWMIILPAAISTSKVTCSASSQLGQKGTADSQCFKKRLWEGEHAGIRARWSHGIHYSSYKALQWMASGSLCHQLELCQIPQWNSAVTQSRWPPRAQVGGYARPSCATAARQWLGPQWTAFGAIVFCWSQTVGGGFIFRTTALCMHRSAGCSGCLFNVLEWGQPLWCLLDAMESFIELA